jgi:hypothetical protein
MAIVKACIAEILNYRKKRYKSVQEVIQFTGGEGSLGRNRRQENVDVFNSSRTVKSSPSALHNGQVNYLGAVQWYSAALLYSHILRNAYQNQDLAINDIYA